MSLLWATEIILAQNHFVTPSRSMFSQAELSKYAEIFQAQGQVNGFLPGKHAIASLHLSPFSHHVPLFIIRRCDGKDHVLKLRIACEQA
jgi:hypothetical protein